LTRSHEGENDDLLACVAGRRGCNSETKGPLLASGEHKIKPLIGRWGSVPLLIALVAFPSAASAAPPANDNFASAEALSGTVDSDSGTNAQATKEAGEPNHAGNPGGASVWYSWTAPQSRGVRVDTCNSATSINTLLAVYTASGTVPPFSNLTLVDSNDDLGYGGGAYGCGHPEQSSLTFEATAGTAYYIAVDGAGGEMGLFSLDLDVTLNDDFGDAETLSTNHQDDFSRLFRDLSNTFGASKETGEPNHAGNGGGASIWYSWTAPWSASVETETCGPSDFDTLLAVYRASGAVPPFSNLTPVASSNDVSNVFGCEPGESLLHFNATAGTTYYIAVDGFNGAAGQVGFFLVQSSQQPPPFGGGTGVLTLGLPAEPSACLSAPRNCDLKAAIKKCKKKWRPGKKRKKCIRLARQVAEANRPG
jgi:hypothetical protein